MKKRTKMNNIEDALNKLEDMTHGILAYYKQKVSVKVKGSGVDDSQLQTMSLGEARDYRYKVESEWWDEGFKRRYKNSRYNHKPIDQNLFTRGKKHEEWRRFFITYQDGRVE